MEAKTREELLAMYEQVGKFTVEGLAQARKGKEWFHIRIDGSPAYEKRFDWVGPFSNGQAVAHEGVAEILIDTKGEQVFLN